MKKNEPVPKDLEKALSRFPRSRIWLFNSGDIFAGNVKYLFLYVANTRKDIYACYISESGATAEYIRSLGYAACAFGTPTAAAILPRAGYYVVEQVKENYPPELLHTKILNLFHGVGLKAIERCWDREFLAVNIAKKYIRFNTTFHRNMCFLVTSPFMETHFRKQVDLREDQIIRAGYPRCARIKEAYAHTFEPESVLDVVQAGTRIALYVPTYREHNAKNFLYKAIADIRALLKTLAESRILLIIKLHPKISDDFYFAKIKHIADNSQNLLLWNNRYDVYEIFDRIDIGIIDYSSMYYDLLAAGVKTFIRYVFDYNEEKEFLIYDYFSNTTGIVCENFAQLLDALRLVGKQKPSATPNEAIMQKFWAYTTPDDCAAIIDQALSFQVQDSLTLPALYSFDIFDTLLARRVLKPYGIFYYVQHKIRTANGSEAFPGIFAFQYPGIRRDAEANVRLHVKKAIGDVEITFDAIFDRLRDVYDLTEQQAALLRAWELEAEFANVIPCTKNIDVAEGLLADGEKVVLISDMYLPLDVIRKMLSAVSPKLAAQEIFLSSEVGVQKTSKKLFLSVYRHLAPWRFSEWHHYGDNDFADRSVPETLSIVPHIHAIPHFNEFEEGLTAYAGTYDAFLVAAVLARKREARPLTDKEYYAFAHISLCFVPYIAWAVRSAVRKHIKTLYFISRDGHFLRKIADAYIEKHGLQGQIRTKYLYGSRRVWRLPAMVETIDEEFFSNFGNFVGVDSYQKLLASLDITHNAFQKMFPELDLKHSSRLTKNEIDSLIAYFKDSETFRTYILQKASEKRNIVIAYLRQEMDFSEPFACVEFWGRGYTQTLFGRLINIAAGNPLKNIYYYYRSILPSQGDDIRYNFTTNTASLIFFEAVFANHPFQTVKAYQNQGATITQVMDTQSFDAELFYMLGTKTLEFLDAFYSLPFLGDIETIERQCADYELSWFQTKPNDPVLVNSIAHLKDSVALWGDIHEFAPALTLTHIKLLESGKPASTFTRSLPMSLARASADVQEAYQAYLLGDKTDRQALPTEARTKKDRLLLKLQKNPVRFFADSKNPLLRVAGAVCLSSLLKGSLGKLLVTATKRQLEK